MMAAYAATVPSTAPASASAPAVTPVIVRRVQLLAPVAARVRRSLAVSLRIRPTDMARMPSASTTPNTVAQLMMSAEVGMLFLVSMDIPAAAAVARALVICVGVGGFGVWTNQATVFPGPAPVRWRVRTACSVNTVFGADVPDGSALISWITGLARQLLFGQGKDCWPCGPPPPGPPCCPPPPLVLNGSCILPSPDSPGRMLSTSAFGSTWLAGM